MRKRYKRGLIVIGVLLLLVVLFGLLKIFFKEKEPKKEPTNVTSIIKTIDEYGYTLDDRDTDYMKENFQDLENILSEDEIDYEAYAIYLAKLYIIDFYTLNNKINKYDVGSLEYIFSSKIESFKNNAVSTIYKDIIDNTYKDRVQELPEITNVQVIDIEETTFMIMEEEYAAFKIVLDFSYKEDLGYDKEGTLYLVKNENKLEVAYYVPEIEGED